MTLVELLMTSLLAGHSRMDVSLSSKLTFAALKTAGVLISRHLASFTALLGEIEIITIQSHEFVHGKQLATTGFQIFWTGAMMFMKELIPLQSSFFHHIQVLFDGSWSSPLGLGIPWMKPLVEPFLTPFF
jgi:hypothetical protein